MTRLAILGDNATVKENLAAAVRGFDPGQLLPGDAALHRACADWDGYPPELGIPLAWVPHTLAFYTTDMAGGKHVHLMPLNMWWNDERGYYENLADAVWRIPSTCYFDRIEVNDAAGDCRYTLSEKECSLRKGTQLPAGADFGWKKGDFRWTTS